MASPQIENGYTRIANELMDALAGIRISGEARQCLDVVIRKTYGFQKIEDFISLSQFCLITKLGKGKVCRSLGKLKKMNLIITKKGNGLGNLYRFNKDFDTWKPLPKKVTVTNIGNGHYQKREKSLPKKGHTKEKKETITKEKGEQSSQEVSTLIKSFESINPACSKYYANTTQRKACENLTNQFGFERVKLIIEKTIPKTNTLEFFPSITTPLQLWEKWASLEAAVRKFKSKEDKTSKVIFS